MSAEKLNCQVTPGMAKATLCAVIPCLNEEKTIGELIDSLTNFDVLPIVVDDGSTDNTRTIAESKGAIVIRHNQNRGTGAAIKTGYVYAMNSFDDDSIVLIVAGDGQHRVLEIPHLIKEILANKADYVVGERFSQGSKRFGMPAFNYVFGKILNFLLSMWIRIDVQDSTCGFTAIRIGMLKRLKLCFPARAAETVEMLLECSRSKMRVTFVSITPVYGRKSKISKLTFLMELLKVYVRGMMSEPRSASVVKVLTMASNTM